jgi:hypothetical protein
VLASRLVNTLDQNGQDPTEVLLPYDYGDKFSHIIAEGLGISQAVTAKGLGIHSGIHQCQNQGRGGQSQQLPDAQRPTNPPQAQVTVLRLVGRSVRRARDGVILKSTTNKGGLL